MGWPEGIAVASKAVIGAPLTERHWTLKKGLKKTKSNSRKEKPNGPKKSLTFLALLRPVNT